jgi:hypothetical protein
VLAKPILGLSTSASEAAAITIGVVSFENLLIISSKPLFYVHYPSSEWRALLADRANYLHPKEL